MRGLEIGPISENFVLALRDSNPCACGNPLEQVEDFGDCSSHLASFLGKSQGNLESPLFQHYALIRGFAEWLRNVYRSGGLWLCNWRSARSRSSFCWVSTASSA